MKKVLLSLLIISLFLPKNILAFTDSSKASIVMDIDSGRILYQKNSNKELLIASTTKIMTFLVAVKYKSQNLFDKVIVGEEVLKMYGTNMYLSLDEELTLIDLLYGLMLRSGNDASVVIANYVSKNEDEFVKLMNKTAEEIGMINSSFKNPHGLDEETKNYSTAYDLAVLTRYLYTKYPLYKQIAGCKYYDFKSNQKSYELINRSKIIFDYKKTTTAKTGYTPSAGKSLVSTATNDNLNLLIVTLDDGNHYQNHQNMYEYFFSLYSNYKIIDKNNFTISKNIFNFPYYVLNDFTYPLTSLEKEKIENKIIINEKNNSLGTIKILLNGNLIHEQEIFKQEKVLKKDSFFKKILNFIKNIFK